MLPAVPGSVEVVTACVLGGIFEPVLMAGGVVDAGKEGRTFGVGREIWLERIPFCISVAVTVVVDPTVTVIGALQASMVLPSARGRKSTRRNSM